MKNAIWGMHLGLALLVAAASFSSSAKADLGPIGDKCRAISHTAIVEAEEFYDELYAHGHPRDPMVESSTEEFLGSIRHFNKHIKKFEGLTELKTRFEEIRSKYRNMRSTLENSNLSRYPKVMKKFEHLSRPYGELADVVDHA